MAGRNTKAGMMTAKSNRAFMILSALAILFVVDSHIADGIGFLSVIFPYDSYYMPLFVFISGYFFKERNVENVKSTCRYLLSRCKKYLLPFSLWAAFYGIFSALLRAWGVINFGPYPMPDFLSQLFATGVTFGFNDSSWFVLTLFNVSVCYAVVRLLLKRIWNDWVAFAVFAVLGMGAAYASHAGYNTIDRYVLLKICFFIQFYQLGVVFRNNLEALFDKASLLLICLSAVAVNFVLLTLYGYDIAFPYCANMAGFYTNNPILPLITSITGIAFWLKISKALVPLLGENKLVNFISSQTHFIMVHHLTFKMLFTGLLILGKKAGIQAFSGVSAEQFRASPWYVIDIPWARAVCFLFTIAMLLLSGMVFLCVKRWFFAKLAALRKKPPLPEATDIA